MVGEDFLRGRARALDHVGVGSAEIAAEGIEQHPLADGAVAVGEHVRNAVEPTDRD